MAKSKEPTPVQEFVAQIRKALYAFWVGAVGTVGTAISTAYATSGQLSNLDPYALGVAALGGGLAAAAAVYKVANAGAKYQSPAGGLEPQSVPHPGTDGLDRVPFIDDDGTGDDPAPLPTSVVATAPDLRSGPYAPVNDLV